MKQPRAYLHFGQGNECRSTQRVSIVHTGYPRVNLAKDATTTPYQIYWCGKWRRVWQVWRHCDLIGTYRHTFIRDASGKEIAGVQIITD